MPAVIAIGSNIYISTTARRYKLQDIHIYKRVLSVEASLVPGRFIRI